jgi:hypothetical protein
MQQWSPAGQSLSCAQPARPEDSVQEPFTQPVPPKQSALLRQGRPAVTTHWELEQIVPAGQRAPALAQPQLPPTQAPAR